MIVFIDELDALAPKRGETGAHSDMRAVTQLLSLMDGLTRVNSVIVIGTTNRVDAVDPAFRRPGPLRSRDLRRAARWQAAAKSSKFRRAKCR